MRLFDFLRKARLTIFVVMACLILGARIAWGAEQTLNADIYGRWRIVKVLGAADISAMSDRQARTLIGKPVDIRPDAFVFSGEKCESPTYERATEDLVQSFRDEGHARVLGLGLPDPVTSIDVRCSHIFLKKPGVIVIHWNGYYFDAVRRNRKSR